MTTRILIGITTCHKAVYPDVLSRSAPTNNALCAEYSRRTWIKDALTNNVDVRFFYGRGGTRDCLWDEVFLDCDDSYDGLVDKVTAMTAWAYDHGYDYFMKVDVDSYVHIQNLLASEFRDWDYTGRGWGLGYILSRKAMQIVFQNTQRRSWAEDSHVLRTLFAWGNKGRENVIRLYGDGRYCFLANFPVADLPLYDKAFIVANPMTPERMELLDRTHSLRSIMPVKFTKEDLWTGGKLRVEHSGVFNAFAIKGEKCLLNYDAWVAESAYNRQPYKDWSNVVHACLITEQMADCPSFSDWMGPIEGRKIILDWARKIIEKNEAIMQALSKEFKDRHAHAHDAATKVDTLFAVVTCKKYEHRAQKQLETWIPRARALGFNVEVFDGARLGVPDDYLSLPLKIKALCTWARQRGYKHLLKMDDDAYIFAEKLDIVIEDYAGIGVRRNDCGDPAHNMAALPDGTCQFDYASGGAYWLSAKSMDLLIAAPFNGDWAEDRWVGQTLGKAGIQFTALPGYCVIMPETRDYAHFSIQDALASKELVVLTQVPDLDVVERKA